MSSCGPTRWPAPCAKTPTPFPAWVSGVADAGTASSDIIPTAITARTAASATRTRPAAGRTSQAVVRLAGIVVTVDQSSSRQRRCRGFWGGWQLKEEHRLVRFSSHSRGGPWTVTAGMFWQPSAPFKLVFGGNPRTRRRRVAGAPGQPSAARASAPTPQPPGTRVVAFRGGCRLGVGTGQVVRWMATPRSSPPWRRRGPMLRAVPKNSCRPLSSPAARVSPMSRPPP